MVEFTVLMPSLNEAETIGICIKKATAFFENHSISAEILIADNGSTDGSQDISTALGARVIEVEERGYGAALLAGIKAARGQYIIMGDSDNSYDFSDLKPFVDALRDGASLVMGNRFRGGISPNAMPKLHRYLGNPVLSFIGRIFYQTPVRDFHCGLRGFSRDAILRLNLNSPGMEFASEMVVKASLFGLPIVEVPTTLSPDGRTRSPHLRSWRDGWRHLKLLLSFAPNWLFLYPGIFLFFVGLLLFAALMTGPVNISGVRFDIASLILAIAAILTGAQMVFFYGLAKLYALKYSGYPLTGRFEKLKRVVSVDKACIAGVFLVVFGTLSAIFSVVFWIGQGLGDLDPEIIARPAALAVVGISLGVQTITSGFLWGILNEGVEL